MHQPVLLNEVVKIFDPQPNQNFIDCTIDGGGHSLKILELTAPHGKILGIDWDKSLFDILKLKVEFTEKERLVLVCDNFAHLKEIVAQHPIGKISGIIFDFGVSSYHLDKSGAGFSFLRDEPLDMRFARQGHSKTARDIVNLLNAKELARIIKDYGQERYAKSIAEAIERERQNYEIKTTRQLIEIIAKAVPVSYQNMRLHFATRTFQSLRIAVNNELENISQGLAAAVEILPKDAKIVAISFHSLEDKIVKNVFKDAAKNGILKIITKKPVLPSFAEIKENPRSRSAKLRVAQKIT